MTFTTVLQNIGSTEYSPSPRDLKVFSELDRADHDVFWSAWQVIAPARRFEIAHAMIELCEDDVETQFNQVWFWLLEDPEAAVRASAIEGLWEDVTPRTLRRMLAMFQTETDMDVRAAIATSLSRFAYLAALGELDDQAPALRQALTRVTLNADEPQEVQRRALESAGYFSDSEVIQRQIARAYDSGEQLLRESALVAMGRSMNPRWLPTIERELSSASPALRYEAARAAGEMAEEGQTLLPKLMPLVNDKDTEVATTAIWALGQIGGDAARAALQRVRRSQDTARSQAAAEALDELSLENGII